VQHNASGSSASVEWWWLLCGVSLVLIPAGALATRWAAIRASHPAYLVLLGGVAVLGFLLSWRGVRRTGSRRARSRVGTRIALIAVIVVVGGIAWWLRPLPATGIALDAMVDDHLVTVNDTTTRINLDPRRDVQRVELLFYPGGLVDPRAYANILRPIAEIGYPVTIIKPPLGFAFFARRPVIDRTDRATVVGGHSLGGVAAAGHASAQADIDGLLLWAAYPAGDLADRTALQAMSIYGSEDGLTTTADVAASQTKLPASTQFVEITGAVHSHFGDYGEQRGDGTPIISRAEAQAEIVAATLRLLGEVSSRTAR
jgi:hypothetical protein